MAAIENSQLRCNCSRAREACRFSVDSRFVSQKQKRAEWRVVAC